MTVAAVSARCSFALAYAKRGWPIVPTVDKRPVGGFGLSFATTDEATIREWWARWPDAEPGVACRAAGLCVVDVDNLDAWDALAGDSPSGASLVAKTPRGGRHYVYAADDRGEVKSLTDWRTGIDVKADGGNHGGLIVLPSGEPDREWLDGDPFELDELAPPPTWLADLLPRVEAAPTPASAPAPAASTSSTTTSRSEWADLVAGAGEGSRNASLARLVGHWLARGLDVDEVRAIAEGWATRCSPPLPLVEARRVVESVAKGDRARHPERHAAAGDAEAPSAPIARPRWHRQPLYDVVATQPQPWLIRRWLRRGQVGMVGAFSTVGKSTLAAGWCASVATGTPWCGCRVAAGSVLALVGEGRRGFALRVEAAIDETGRPIAAGCVVEIVDFREPLSSPSGQRALRDLFAEFVADHGHAPAFAVVDTVSSHWAESEDASEFAAPFVRTLADVASEHGCAVVGVHHTTKAKDRNTMPTLADFRGSGAFVCNIDVAVGMCCDGADAVRVEALKVKDDELPEPLRLVRGAAAMGEDAEGEPVTAALLLPSELPPGPQADPADLERKRRAERHRSNVAAVVAALREMGSATKVDAVVKAAGVRLIDGRAAFDAAVSAGEIVATGSRSRPVYVVRGGGEHPTPLGTSGTLSVPTSDDVPDDADDADDNREHPDQPAGGGE